MSNQAFQILALLVYFAAMLAIGYYAYKKTSSHADYMLADRGLNHWVAALSAGAADMSGWLMMGLPGAVYASGLIGAWMTVGLTVGAYLNWKIVAPRLRAYTEVSKNSITIPSFFENRLRDSRHILRVISSLVILVFFTLYISASMVAAGKFFQTSFTINTNVIHMSPYMFGMVIVGTITLIYTLFGGFLGASLTDVVQGVMMMVALIIVPIVAIISIGGPIKTRNIIEDINPPYLSFFSDKGLSLSTLLTIVTVAAWGLGYFGQPHIIVRFMALTTPQAAKPARRIGIGWMIITLGGSVVSGMAGFAYFHKQGIQLADPESVALKLSQILLHPFIAGMVLAAVLAAIMSTTSSQLIVCSSALIEDIYRIFNKNSTQKSLVILSRLSVLLVTIIAFILSLTPSDTILGLVAFAWAGFGASFGPIVILSLYWKRLNNWGALAGMISGAITVFVWHYLPTEIYELLPAFIVGILFAVCVSLATKAPEKNVEEEFLAMKSYLKGKYHFLPSEIEKSGTITPSSSLINK